MLRQTLKIHDLSSHSALSHEKEPKKRLKKEESLQLRKSAPRTFRKVKVPPTMEYENLSFTINQIIKFFTKIFE